MLDMLNDLLWGKVLLVLLVGVGIGFTVASRFVQFRYFGEMFRILGSGQAFKRNKHGHLARSRRWCFRLPGVSVAATSPV